MTSEIPIWVNGSIRWVAGIDRRTNCTDVIEVLLSAEGMGRSDVKDYQIMERWRRVEKPLDENAKILKVWSHWGDEKKEVRLCLKRIENEADSGRGSPVGAGNTPSLRRRRRSRGTGKPPWGPQEDLHPRRLAELGGFNRDEYEEYQLRRLEQLEASDGKMKKKLSEPLYASRHCLYARKQELENAESCRKKPKGCTGTGVLHSTLITEHCAKPSTSKCCSKKQAKQKVRNSENIEKLMKLILAQGATIQTQLQKLKEREEQIESMEHERHRERLEKNGRNYLLETYLGSLGEAEAPEMNEEDEEKGNDSGVHTEGGSDQTAAWENQPLIEDKDMKRASRRGRLKTQGDEQEAKLDKSQRSKSESRTQECNIEEIECNKNLKRTKSENVLGEPESQIEPNAMSSSNAKEDSEEMIELRRVQSQYEMWEKVFKVNRKLEKEEENLVRLHIKIRRFQTESLKIAKELDDQKESTEEEVAGAAACTDTEDTELRKDWRMAEKSLETLRSDLDQNSKEIYKNFTQLIKGDDEVESKKRYLTQLMADLESADEESQPSVVPKVKEEEHMQSTSFNEHPVTTESPQPLDNVGISLIVKGQEKDPTMELPLIPTPLRSVTRTELQQRNLQAALSNYGETSTLHCAENTLAETKASSSTADSPQDIAHSTTQTCQRLDSSDTQGDAVRPKTVKISFDETIQDSENVASVQEKQKEPVSTAGAIKGILKNRNRSMTNVLENINIQLPNLEKMSTNHGTNIDQKREKVDEKSLVYETYAPKPSMRPPETGSYQIYSNPVNPCYTNPIYGENPYRFALANRSPLRKGETTYSKLQDMQHHRALPNAFPVNTLTTKAVVHNDTDSSTSSDTSGLSSMYSSSPTVEEPYGEARYVLDTLV